MKASQLEYSARPLFAAFLVIASYVLLQLIATGGLGWFVSTLWMLGIVGSLGYFARLGRLSDALFLIAYSGALSTSLIGGYAVLADLETETSFLPVWFEAIVATGMVVSLSLLRREDRKRRRTSPPLPGNVRGKDR
jgi:hypothetical protein